MALHVLQKHSWSHSPSRQRSRGMLEREEDDSKIPVLVSRRNPHLVHTSHGAICYARRSHVIKYEMITGHFTAQGCLFGWNRVVVSEKLFPLSDKACMGMRQEKYIIQVFACKSSQTAQEQWLSAVQTASQGFPSLPGSRLARFAA